MIATHLIFFFFGSDYVPPTPPPPVVETPLQSGGLGSAQFYRGKYRNDVRKAIESAIDGTRAARLAKPGISSARKLKQMARVVAQAIDIEVPAPVVMAEAPELAGLEVIRRQIAALSNVLSDIETDRLATREAEAQRERDARRKAASLQAAMVAYIEEAIRIEQRDEEDMIAIVIAMDSRN